MTKQHTTEQFIQKAKLIHGDKYDYSQVIYKSSIYKVIITCPIHGSYSQTPNKHLLSNGCPICENTSKISKAKLEFIDRANQIHNNKYDYSLVDYKNNSTKIKIICSQHGVYETSPENHIFGKGCCVCGVHNSEYMFNKFKDRCIKNNNGLGILYVIGCWSDDKSEVFIKIGITSRSVQKRFNSKTQMPYNYKIIHEVVGSPEYIYDLETKLHNKSNKYSYWPNIQFSGASECFKADTTYLSKLNNYISELIPF